MLKDACIIEKFSFKKGIAAFDDFLFVALNKIQPDISRLKCKKFSVWV